MLDVENVVSEFIGQFLGSDIRLPILILGILFLLYIIGRQPVIKVLTSIVRGTMYLFVMAIAGYLIKYYPEEILHYLEQMWKDILNFFGLG